MDAENLATDSAKSPERPEPPELPQASELPEPEDAPESRETPKSPEADRPTDMHTAHRATLRGVGAKLQPEHSEFEDPGFRAFWLMPVGLGIVLVVAALVISMT